MPVSARKRVIVNKFKDMLYWPTLGSLKLCFSSEAMPVTRIQGSTTYHPKGLGGVHLVERPRVAKLPYFLGVSRCANVDYPLSS